MKKQINDLLLKMQTSENCIGETANELLNLFSVSKRYIVCTDINYKNELTVISHEFTDIEDAKLFKEHCLKTEKYKGKNLVILNVC